MLALTAATAWYYQHEKSMIRQRAMDHLTSIGRLKADQIAAWRKERLADAAVLARGVAFADNIVRFMADPGAEQARKLRAGLNHYKEHYHYADVLLVDTQGSCRLNLSGKQTQADKFRQALAPALETRQPYLTDLHADQGIPATHVGAIAPIFSGNDAAAPLGAVILISHADQFLYPLLRSWPAPSATAETIICRREGGDVLYLAPLRHQADSALRLRIPLTRTNTPAVRAAMGYAGIAAGVDYRGARVLSYVTAISNTPWFLVAKQDEAEIFAEWQYRSRMIRGAFLAWAIGIIGILAAAWQRNNKAHYRELYNAEARQRAAAEEEAIILRAIGDAVIATGNDGRVNLMNSAAEELTGWTEDAARGQPLATVFNIISEETRQPAENPVARVLREGVIVGLANHTLLISRDGRERPIADSAAPIFDEKGGIIGVVLVFRDKTAEWNYRALFEKMLDGFAVHELICDAEGRPADYRFLEVNPAAERMLGRPAGEIIGKTVRQLFPQIETYWIEMYGRVAQTGVPAHFEYFAEPLNKYFEVSAFRTHAHQFAAIFQDITLRHQTAQALQESERRHRSLTDDVLDNTEVGIIILDNRFHVVLINHAIERFFGLRREETIGNSKRQLIQDRIAGIFEDPEDFKARLFATYNDNTYVEKFECRVMPEGSRQGRWLQHWSKPITTGLYAGGRIEYYYDITELKQAEEEQRRLFSAIEQSGDIVVITDPDGNIQYVNRTFEKVTGYTRAEVLGKNPRLLKSGKQDDEFYRKMWTQITAGKVFRARMVNKTKDESLYTEDATISPVFEKSGKIVNYVGVKRDVTERLSMEAQLQQAQKMELVGRLAGGVAHDFNNMLGAILGNAELALEQTPPDAPTYPEIEEIIAAARRSADITQQLLAFARKQITSPKLLELNDTISGMLKMLKRLIGENIELAWLPSKTPCVVKLDPSQLSQVLANLCINARDAIRDVGKIAIETGKVQLDGKFCSNHPGAAPGQYVLLKISDNGSGMDAEMMTHLFEPFYTTKEVGRGTGLGLATVHGIVTQNHGAIFADSRPGQGTTFRIYFPCQADAAVEPPPPPPPDLPRGKGETILLVEDEIAVLRLAQTMLSRMGYRVLTAADPEIALQLAKEHAGSINILMTDVVMPGMNGRDLAARITELSPGIKRLFMSGYTADTIAHQGLLEQNVFFLQKPFSRQDLAAALQKVLAAT